MHGTLDCVPSTSVFFLAQHCQAKWGYKDLEQLKRRVLEFRIKTGNKSGDINFSKKWNPWDDNIHKLFEDEKIGIIVLNFYTGPEKKLRELGLARTFVYYEACGRMQMWTDDLDWN